MAADVPSSRTRLYVAVIGAGLLTVSGGVAWLVWLAAETGHISVRSGVVTWTDSPIRFSIEIVLGVFSVLVMGVTAMMLLTAALRPSQRGREAKGRRRF